MIVDCIISLDELERVLAEHGGRIDWSNRSLPGAPPVCLSVKDAEVDNEEAYGALPWSYLHGEDEIEDRADPGDVRDFVAACGRGDRLIAQALAPRIFLEHQPLRIRAGPLRSEGGMSDIYPFSPERLAALARLSAEINAMSAPGPSAEIVVAEDGFVELPVPNHPAVARDAGRCVVRVFLHPGLTLQWAAAQGGCVVAFRAGDPDGDPFRGQAVSFLTARGLRELAKDLNAIADAVEGGAA